MRNADVSSTIAYNDIVHITSNIFSDLIIAIITNGIMLSTITKP